MAKEKEEGKKQEHSKKPKKRLRGLMTHIADDGSFVHEHHYEDHKGHRLPPSYGGVSQDMDDLHQHMDDHAAPAAAELGGGGGAAPDDEEEAQPEGAPNAGGPEPEEQ